MLLLAFDTATPAVTAALVRHTDGSVEVLAERTEVDARRQGELLAPAITGVLADAGVARTELGGIVVGVGPGPFTGLRVGVVTARVMGTVLGIPVTGVCTLDALAVAAGVPDGRFVVATDARRREVYWSAYDAGGPLPSPLAEAAVDKPGDVATQLPAYGAGAGLYPEAFPHRPAGPELPSAADLVRWMAGGGRTYSSTPLYLRRPDAAEPPGRKQVLT